MKAFGVLTSRKRAVIALIHSIVFLGIAFRGFVSPKAGVLHRSGAMGDFILIAIYLVVASILVWLRCEILPLTLDPTPSYRHELDSNGALL
jgi:hypothetical protein